MLIVEVVGINTAKSKLDEANYVTMSLVEPLPRFDKSSDGEPGLRRVQRGGVTSTQPRGSVYQVTPVRKVRLGAYIGCPFLNRAKFANNSRSSSAVRALAIESDYYRNQDGVRAGGMLDRSSTSFGGSRDRPNGQHPIGSDLPPPTLDLPAGSFWIGMPDGDPTDPAKPDQTAYTIASYVEATLRLFVELETAVQTTSSTSKGFVCTAAPTPCPSRQ